MTEPIGCGDCTLCCKVMNVKEYDSPQGEWCKNCDPKRGCQIYETRAEVCRTFECVWLQSQNLTPGKPDDWRLGPELKPNRCHAMIDVSTDKKRCVVHVDAQYPDAYKRGAMARFIEDMVGKGAEVIVVTGALRKLIKGAPA
jgi:hypothetical protein